MSVSVSGVRVSVGVSRCASECGWVNWYTLLCAGVCFVRVDGYTTVRTYIRTCACVVCVCASVFDRPSYKHIRNIYISSH